LDKLATQKDDGTVEVSGTSRKRITSQEQLYTFFGIPWHYIEIKGEKQVYSDQYEIVAFRVNSWEQHSVEKGVVTLYQVRATLKPREPLDKVNVMKRVWQWAVKDMQKHAPKAYKRPRTPKVFGGKEPALLEIAIFDPHIGMLAWGKECGVPYDSEIAVRDFSNAGRELLAVYEKYNIEHILIPLGNDLFHVDTLAVGGKGATTTRGTQQDIDTRLARMFTHGRRAVVELIDAAREIAPVTVIMVPGNHDEQTVYKLGEVLNAWYRNDKRVEIIYGPNKRKYWQYGKNLLAFTHGEEFKRKRDNLVSIMATESPPEMWASTTHREWHVGHNHIGMAKVWLGDPSEELWEGRAVRVRSLPGLTPEDSWHYTEGYKHRRTATALVYRKSGGVLGIHEFNPE